MLFVLIGARFGLSIVFRDARSEYADSYENDDGDEENAEEEEQEQEEEEEENAGMRSSSPRRNDAVAHSAYGSAEARTGGTFDGKGCVTSGFAQERLPSARPMSAQSAPDVRDADAVARFFVDELAKLDRLVLFSPLLPACACVLSPPFLPPAACRSWSAG